MKLLNAEHPQIHVWFRQTRISYSVVKNSMALPLNKTLDQNYSTLPINNVRIWQSEKTTLYFLLIRD